MDKDKEESEAKKQKESEVVLKPSDDQSTKQINIKLSTSLKE